MKSLILGAVTGLLFCCFLLSQWVSQEFQKIRSLENHYVDVIYHEKDKTTEYIWSEEKPKHWVSLSDIALKARMATVLQEDWAFFQHDGIDFYQLEKVLSAALKTKKISRGASTITQQLMKNLFLSREKSIIRKVKEALLALVGESYLSKDKILETYFNVIEYGEGMYGLGKASQYYFHKPPKDLTPKEGAFLAMILPNPKKYSSSFRKEQLSAYARETIDNILLKMKIAKVLTEEEYEQQKLNSLSFEKSYAEQILDEIFD